MTGIRTPHLQGLWIPLVTPFRDGRIDEASLVRLAEAMVASPVDGLILAATTGEGLTLDDDETRRLVEIAAATVNGRVPLYLGMAGSDTRRLTRRLAETAGWPVEGYLVPAPAYIRPSQEGLHQHFLAVAGASERPVVLYNIPYRTGVNLANETLLRLAEARANIVGLKDCCTDPQQSLDLLRARPAGFAVLTGEDVQYLQALALGADGGILASAHADPAAFARVRMHLQSGEIVAAQHQWAQLVDMVRLFFAEPSPAPLKHWLWRQGVIASPEVRLPMTGVTPALAGRLDRLFQARGVKAAA